VRIEGGTKDEKTLFYTALYHSLLMPSIFDDVNGQYMGMDDQVHDVRDGHHVYATFSGWDTYRTQAQLWGFLYPQAASDVCQTFLETSRQTQYKGGGGLPLWSMFNDETMIMAGYPADPFIASAYAFGARDFEVAALTAVMVDSGKQNRYWGRNNHVTWSHLEDYIKYGYYPDNCGIGHAISQNVEYAIADFSIARMCQAVGDEKNYKYFLERSQSIFNLLHPTEKYLWARNKNRTWKKSFDPYTNDGCQEGTSTHYTWGIPHNLDRLIRGIGGERAAEARLDKLMSQITFGYDYGNPYYLAGNEPCFGVVPVYNWMGRPWKAQAQMRRVMNVSFSNKAEGIPGDDDSGAMSAWYVFAAMGLYPEIPGVGGFAVTGPLFPQITLNLDGDRQIIINAKNAGQTASYIQTMSLNGVPCQQTWLTVEELTEHPKTIIDFTMTAEPNKSWGGDYRPPSFDSEQ
jgi:predicted alpha-1,2-mannosidase